MRNQSTFEGTVNGDTVSIPLARVRELCPDEVRAEETTWRQVSESMEHNDANKITTASKHFALRRISLSAWRMLPGSPFYPKSSLLSQRAALSIPESQALTAQCTYPIHDPCASSG